MNHKYLNCSGVIMARAESNQKHWEEVLSHYNIGGKVTEIKVGPLVETVEFLPAAGTKLKNVAAAAEDIAREMGIASLRVEALENSNLIGFEIPAPEPKTIDFADVLAQSPTPQGKLPICLGVDIAGNPVWADLSKLPHLLMAGTTGSGKSVGLNTFILSLIKCKKPAEVKFILIDPKRVEFAAYNNQKYLFCPVVTDNAKAAATLEYLAQEMERRYALFEENMARNIAEYSEDNPPLPYLVCVIDEFADLMAADKKVEKSVQVLAQKARACGIHLILATQRPSVDVVTGVLKANFPSRLAYKTASATDSRTILDAAGAEKLLGLGDALFLQADGELKRVHGAYVSDKQIAAMLEPYRAVVKPLKPTEVRTAETKAASASKPQKPWLRWVWDFWLSLRQKDRKLIINGIFYLLGFLSGKSNKRSKR